MHELSAGIGRPVKSTTLKLQQAKSPKKPIQGVNRHGNHSAVSRSNRIDGATAKVAPTITTGKAKDYGSDYEDNITSVFKGERRRIKVKTRKVDDPDDVTPNLRWNWSEEEHEKFQFAIQLYANDPKKWTKVAEYIGTRTPHQCRGHFRAYTGTRYKRQKLDPEE